MWVAEFRTIPVSKKKIYDPNYPAVIFVDEDDAATYIIKTLDDPRTLNKSIYLRPSENILSQSDLIVKWENLSGNVLEKIYIPADEFLASMKGKIQMCVFPVIVKDEASSVCNNNKNGTSKYNY